MENEAEFTEMVTKSQSRELNRSLRENQKEYEQAKTRISKFDVIEQRLYEDNIEGKISDERFTKMSATYETEQKQLDCRVSELQAFLDEAIEKSFNAEDFLSLARKYTDIRNWMHRLFVSL